MLSIENHGAWIVKTNFWQTDYGRRGAFFLSINAGAFRLLVPDQHAGILADLKTAKEVVVSRGPWPAVRRDEAFELLFDDHTEEPFSLHFGLEQVDRIPEDIDQVQTWTCTVWTKPRGKDTRPHRALERKAFYRRVGELPYLKPWLEK